MKLPCAILFFLSLGLVSTPSSAADRPNFVLIFIDDMGYGDIGPFGSTLNRTPHLDRMAAEGMKFTSFYAAPVCSASRAQLMTGCYAPRVSIPGVLFPAASRGLHPEEHTVADYLHEAGYATMCVGKWHLGDQREFLPTRQGFDGYLGIPYSNDMGRPRLSDGRSVHPLVRDETVAELLENEDQRQITRRYTEEGVRFIERNRDRSFFLYLPHTAMHVPLYPHQDFVGRSKNGTYGDWVEEVDWSVGQILDALRRLELDRKTLVLFTSDNGPWASRGKDGGVAGPLRGSKGCTLEGGVREPTIAWWPGTVPAGSVCGAVAGTTDVLPTFVHLAGGSLREDVPIDGVDLTPCLFGKTDTSPRDAWYYYNGTQLKAVRSGPWKLAVAPQSLGMGIRERPADLAAEGLRLYNLEEEIGEVTNLADRHPEVVARLLKKVEAMRADIGSGSPGPGVRPAGTVASPVTLFPTRARPSRGGASAKPLDWGKVKVGDTYATASAPKIAGKPFAIEATLEGKAPQGVIVAHGGTVVGYSLYAKGGQAVFAVRRGSSEIRRVSAPLPAEGIVHLRAELSSEGSLRLAIGDAKPATVPAGGLIPSHPQEDLCVGHDDGHPVDPEAPDKRFGGTIARLRVVIPDAD